MNIVMNKVNENKFFSSFSLKCIAVVSMVLDHAGEYLGLPICFRYIGRLAAPIFLFCCVEGCVHTKDRKKHLKYLYFASIVMSLFDAWAMISVNFFRTLFSVSLIVYCMEEYQKTRKKSIWVKYTLWQVFSCLFCYGLLWGNEIFSCKWIDFECLGTYIFPALLGNLLFLEGGVFYVVVGVWFYYARNNRKKLSIGYIILVFGFIFGLQSNPILQYGIIAKLYSLGLFGEILLQSYEVIGELFLNIGGIYYWSPRENYQWMMVFALPIILQYNGEKGKGCKGFFYVFYPLHYIILYVIGTYIVSA